MKPEWLELEGKLIGISLSADFCAEHEWGIDDLKRMLGVDGQKERSSRDPRKYTKPAGIQRRMITKHDHVRLFEHEKSVALICKDSWYFKRFDESVAKDGFAQTFKEMLPRDLYRRELSAAWSEGEFGVYGEGSNAERIKDLYAAFQADNIAIWIGGGNVFQNGGLILCIADRLSEEKAKLLRDADLEAERLTAASDATGILDRLEKAGKKYFACSPRFHGENRKSAYPVIYWLNPVDQDQNNYGWFTVEDLDQWIAGTGPIPMKSQKVR